jgi:hypothetical protein
LTLLETAGAALDSIAEAGALASAKAEAASANPKQADSNVRMKITFSLRPPPAIFALGRILTLGRD